MVGEQIILPHLWQRYLSIMRVLLALACLGTLLASSRFSPVSLTILLILLTFYSLLAVLWRRLEPIGYSLYNLALDTAFFCLVVVHTGAAGFWLHAFFAFYLLLRAATIHTWREVLLVTIASMAILFAFGGEGVPTLPPLILLMGMFATILTLQKKALLERLANSSRQSVLYRSEAGRAREAERQRIAADFHDGPLQSFISFQMRLEILKRMLERDRDAALRELEQLQQLCQGQVTELRAFVRGMRPPEIDGAGLIPSIHRLVKSFEKETGISATFTGDNSDPLEDVEAPTDVLQLVREALNNVQKHSRAARVSVSVHRQPDALRIVVDDDGTGFPFSGTYSLEELELMRVGPASIKRRVRSLNAEMILESHPGKGSNLQVRVPL